LTKKGRTPTSRIALLCRGVSVAKLDRIHRTSNCTTHGTEEQHLCEVKTENLKQENGNPCMHEHTCTWGASSLANKSAKQGRIPYLMTSSI